MGILHFISLMLLLHKGNGQGMGMFDFFGFGGGMADPYGGAIADPFMGGGGGLGGTFGGMAGPQAPMGPDPAIQDARLTMAEEQMAEVMGESPQNSPERQRIDRLISQTGGRFTGDAAPLNYLVEEYMMTTPGPAPPPQPQPRPAKKAKRAKQRQGKMRNRQTGGQNVGNAPNMNRNLRNRPQGAGMQPPAPGPTRPTGRMGNQAPYQPQRPRAMANQAMNQGQRNNLPPANSNIQQKQAPSYKGQPQAYQGNQGQTQTNMYQPQTRQRSFQGPPPPNNNAPPAYQGQQQINRNQGNNFAAQGQMNGNQKQGTTKSRSGVAADRLRRIEGRISSVNDQLNQARNLNNMAQVTDLQAQLEALNGVKQILTGGSAKTSKMKTIRGSANTPAAVPKNSFQQNNVPFGPPQTSRSNGNTLDNKPSQAPYGPPQIQRSNFNNVNNKPNQAQFGPPQNNRNNGNNGRGNVPFGPPKIQRSNGINNGQAKPQYGPPPMRKTNRNNFNNVPSNNNNFQETNVGGGKFAQTWTNNAPAPTTTRQTFQDPYPTAGNVNAYNQQNTGFNQNRRKQPVEVNFQQYQNPAPTNDPYQNNQGVNAAAAAYDPYPTVPGQQAAPYDPYPTAPGQQAAPYDPYPTATGQQAAPYDPYPTAPGQQAAPYDPYPAAPGQQAAPYDPYPTAPAPYDQGMGQQSAQYDPQVLPYDPHATTYQDPGVGPHGMFASNEPAPRQQQRRGQGQRGGGPRRGGSRRRGGRRGGARVPPTTVAPTGTTVAPNLGDTKFIRGEEYIYTDADGYDTFQWIKKSLIPASQLDHLPQAGQEQGGQAAAGGEPAPQPA